MNISKNDVTKINGLLSIVNGARINSQKCTIADRLEDGTEFKVYHMGEANKTIRIDFKDK